MGIWGFTNSNDLSEIAQLIEESQHLNPGSWTLESVHLLMANTFNGGHDGQEDVIEIEKRWQKEQC